VADGLEVYFRALAQELGARPIPVELHDIAIALEQHPEPLSASPDGRLLLERSLSDTAHALVIRPRRDGPPIVTIPSSSRPAGPAWSPDSKHLAYFVDSLGDQVYRLIVSDLSRSDKSSLRTPPTRSPLAWWSPDGRQIAYIVDGFDASTRTLQVVSIRRGIGTHALLGDVARHSGVAWSPDGQTLAVSVRGDEGALTLIGFDGQRRRVDVVDYGQIREIVWPADCGCLFVTARREGDEFFRLIRVSISGATQEVASADGDIIEARTAGPFVAYHLLKDGEVTPYLSDGDGRGVSAPRVPGGSTRLIGYDARNKSFIAVTTGFSSAPRVMSLPAGTAPAGADAVADTLAPERLRVGSAGGLKIPVILWRTANGARPPRLLVLVHGGPALQSLPTWDAGIQYALRAGVSVLAINYRGSTGYGAAFEGHATDIEGQVDDLLASISFASRKLRIPYDRVILWGHSHGALLVERTLRRMHDFAGRAVLVSYIGDPLLRDNMPTSRAQIMAYHGKQDVVRSPESAYAELHRIFGNALLDFESLSDEGHSFRRALSWARVYHSALSEPAVRSTGRSRTVSAFQLPKATEETALRSHRDATRLDRTSR
jgi:dipeptidyl aminopeptidase/acylaminoacyl peptidase